MNQERFVSRLLTLAILASCGGGAWLSGELVKQQADLWNGKGVAEGGILGRMCAATESLGLGCEGASTSAWSRVEIPLPVLARDFTVSKRTVVVPVAFVGLAYFAVMGIWFAFIGGPRVRGWRWQRIPLVVGLGGAAVSLLFIGVMVAGVAPRCVGCLAVHAINLVMVPLVGWSYSRGRRRATNAHASLVWTERSARSLLAPHEVSNALAFSLIVVAGLWFYRGERIALQDRIDDLLPDRDIVTALRNDPEFLLREHFAQPQVEIPPRGGEPLRDGKPRLVLFTDFECRACVCKARRVHNGIMDAFGGNLSVDVRHFPLSSACNENVSTEFHSNACDAAFASEAARIVGGEEAFWGMYRLLYENRSALGDGVYAELAARIGLDPTEFSEALRGDEVRRIVRSDVACATELGVHATPTMYFNGRRVSSLCQTRAFWETIAGRPDLWVRGECLAAADGDVPGDISGNPHRDGE